MEGYLGETVIDITQSEYKNYTKSDWVIFFIVRYGGIDGSHHKDWLLDQIVRILKGTPVIVKIAKWENGHQEERFETGEPTEDYWNFINSIPDYEFGIAP